MVEEQQRLIDNGHVIDGAFILESSMMKAKKIAAAKASVMELAMATTNTRGGSAKGKGRSAKRL